MPYKTILVHVDNSAHAEARIAYALQLALEHDAHLIGAAMVGLSRFVYQDSALDLASTLMAGHIAELAEEARAALDKFEAAVKAAGLRTYEARLIEDDWHGGLACQARYADLVVLSQFDPDDPAARLASGLAEYVLMTSARPLLLVPRQGRFKPPLHALVAWSGSREGGRALADALPILQHAHQVTVSQINAAPDAAQDRQQIVHYLERHGIASSTVLREGEPDVGAALLALARERTADLIIMGGYGHARLRELVMGGVTEYLLRETTVPLLLSH